MEKQFLYHRTPEKLHGEHLVPLNILKKENIDLYLEHAKKYEGREEVMDQPIPGIEGAKWNDVIHMSVIHPDELYRALKEGMKRSGMNPDEIEKKIKTYERMEFYQIDPDLLVSGQSIVYINTGEKKNFIEYTPDSLPLYSSIPERTIDYYAEAFRNNERPFLFLGVPHILHKGEIKNIKSLPVVAIHTSH